MSTSHLLHSQKEHKRKLPPSAFVNLARTTIGNTSVSDRWKLSGGNGCLNLQFIPATEAIQSTGDQYADLVANIWMERPRSGKASCKFEIGGPPELNEFRETIAESMRSFLRSNLPSEIEPSTGCTVVRRILNVPRLLDTHDDTPANAAMYGDEIAKIVEFFRYLDLNLAEWAVRWPKSND